MEEGSLKRRNGRDSQRGSITGGSVQKIIQFVFQMEMKEKNTHTIPGLGKKQVHKHVG